MEKLTIKPWQVMQAHENGAKIECTNKNDDYPWIEPRGVVWNFPEVEYRIANLTADGMRLDELVEKFQDGVILVNKAGSFGNSGIIKIDVLIKELIQNPKLIKLIKVKQEKKLRPWTMLEFEEHRDEWFVTNATSSKRKVIDYNNHCVCVAEYTGPINYKEFAFRFKREDGSPCGVLE